MVFGFVRQSLTRLKVPRSHKPMKRRFGTTLSITSPLKGIVDTNGGHPGRLAAVDKMCATMKKI